MKKFIIFLTSVTLLAACNKQAGDKKAELAELKKQKAGLDAKISVLEKEIGMSAEATAESKIKSVIIVPVQTQTFKHYIEVQGTLDSENNINVTPRMGGNVTQVLVKEGDIVRTGQVLAITDDATLQQNMAQLRTGYELAKTVYERQEKLWEQKIGSEIQYLQAKNQKEGLERQMATLQSQVAMTRIISPINGTVNAVNIKIGEMAAPGMPVVQVVNLLQMKVKAKVADTYINSIKKGDPVTVKLPDINEEMQAKITFVGQVVNPASRTFDVEVALSNPSNKLKPNLLTMLSINDKVKQNVLVIDENLIQNTELGDIVFIAVTENGKTIAKMKKVKKGLVYNGKTEITEGLTAGDQLITVGNQDLVEGQAVKLEQPIAEK
ncbi:MAG: efflux RND transporter periplasmic adaptor subunit [Verrucomicrobia bacterium]|nr:efflux RND transporter periplasmic adaptor subunit [Cytophagales bacterium]